MAKYIFITGVSSGIGHGLASHYLSKGHTVIGTVRNAQDAADLVKQGLHSIIYDVVDKAGLSEVVIALKNILGDHPLHALINNAGIAKAGPLEHVSDADFELQMEVNVNAVRRITNALLPVMKADSRIINISSVSGLFNSPFTGPYCISKHALESMCDIYRRELAMFGIKVIAIEPGPIKTKIWGKAKGTFDQFMDTRYASLAPNADKMIDTAERHALDVSYVVAACDKAMFLDSPKPRYIVHKKKRMFKFIASYVPDRMLDWLVAKNLKKGDKHRAI
jgi:NAD(P)-dependent dehydrogenase (short-subunit alcohol dehydrogenase family)